MTLTPPSGTSVVVPPAPGKDPRSRRYPANIMNLAQRMYANGEGWTPTQIRRYFRDHGMTPVPSRTTIELWVKPEAAEEYRRQRSNRNRITDQSVTEQPTDSPKTRIRRMRALREAGLTYTGIAAVMNLDYGISITSETARYLLGQNPSGNTIRKHLAPEAA